MWPVHAQFRLSHSLIKFWGLVLANVPKNPLNYMYYDLRYLLLSHFYLLLIKNSQSTNSGKEIFARNLCWLNRFPQRLRNARVLIPWDSIFRPLDLIMKPIGQYSKTHIIFFTISRFRGYPILIHHVLLKDWYFTPDPRKIARPYQTRDYRVRSFL